MSHFIHKKGAPKPRYSSQSKTLQPAVWQETFIFRASCRSHLYAIIDGTWQVTLHGKANIFLENPRNLKEKKNQVFREAFHWGRNSPLVSGSQCAAAGQLLLTQWCPAVKPEESLQVGSDQTFDTSAAEPFPRSHTAGRSCTHFCWSCAFTTML